MNPTVDDAAKALQTAPERLQRAMQPVLIGSSLRAERQAKLNVSGLVLNTRTGRLRASIAGSVEAVDGSIDVVLRAGNAAVRYAKIHEEGGEIVPKNGRFLAIPTDFAKTASGVSRYASARDVPNLTLIITRGGRSGVLVQQTAKADNIFFNLVRRVRIPKRPYLRPALEAEIPVLSEKVASTAALALIGGSDGR